MLASPVLKYVPKKYERKVKLPLARRNGLSHKSFTLLTFVLFRYILSITGEASKKYANSPETLQDFPGSISSVVTSYPTRSIRGAGCEFFSGRKKYIVPLHYDFPQHQNGNIKEILKFGQILGVPRTGMKFFVSGFSETILALDPPCD